MVALAKKAVSASREAVLLAEQSKLFGTNFDVSLSPRYIAFDSIIPAFYISISCFQVKDGHNTFFQCADFRIG